MPERDDGAQPPPAARLAKPAKSTYRRDLPHLQAPHKTLFVTFNTWHRWVLPETARSLVLDHCLHDHGTKAWVHGVVVMPDHVHMVLTPLMDADGSDYGFAEIMNGIKGTSAHTINRALRRRGRVWQSESFDRLLRRDEDVRQVVEYVCRNPVEAGIADDPDDYPWIWREWIEGSGSRDR